MQNNTSPQNSPEALARAIPIIRGLLAEKTPDPDFPFKPVILRTLTTKEAFDFASDPKNADAPPPTPLTKSKLPPLFLDIADYTDDQEKLRQHLNTAFNGYAAEHNTKPAVIALGDTGVLYPEPGDKKNELADSPLNNKIALVTGAAGAIGYGICRALLENGCHLAATDLPGQRFDNFIDDLKKIAEDRVIGVPIDVTDKASVSAGFGNVINTWGGIDIVVVNAGIAMVCQLKDIELDEFRKLQKVNVEGALLTLAEAGRHFILQATGGDIIVISTKNVPSPGAGFGAYSATKAACHQLGRIASLELAQHGVRVNMVAPDAVFDEGPYKSGLWEKIGKDRMRARNLDEDGLKEYYRNRNLLKISVTARHVGNAVLFFATRQTPTTGATIPVDGGLPDATPR